MNPFRRAHPAQWHWADPRTAEQTGHALIDGLQRADKRDPDRPDWQFRGYEDVVLTLAGARVIVEPAAQAHSVPGADPFELAGSLVALSSDLYYVEGFALADCGSEWDGVPIRHAWTVDRRGLLVDHCAPSGGTRTVAYLGVPFAWPLVERLRDHHECSSVFDADAKGGSDMLRNGVRQDQRGVVWAFAS